MIWFYKNCLNFSKATEQGTGVLGATRELFKLCWKTLTTKRPARIYITLCFFADFVARMTFTGDLGTMYPYLTLPKFEFTKVKIFYVRVETKTYRTKFFFIFAKLENLGYYFAEEK